MTTLPTVEFRQGGGAGTEEEVRPSASRRRAVAKQRINPIAYWRLLTGGSAKEEERFLSAMQQRFGASCSCFPLGRARAGIYLLVKFAVRSGRRKVLLSSYTIADVVTMVVLAGGEPVFFDFEPGSTACNLDQFESLIDGQTACAMVTHYHVNEPRLAELLALCRSRGIYLFDDCAIAFGGALNGLPLGTLADGSVFSFSSFKLLNFFWGGLLTTGNPEIAQFVRQTTARWQRLSAAEYWKPAKACLTYDLASRPPFFETLVFPQLRRRTRQSGVATSLENARIETHALNPTITSRPALTAFSEWNRKLPKIGARLFHRRAIAEIYSQRLGDFMVSREVANAVVQGSCFVNFPVLLPEGRRDTICRELMLAGYDVGRSLYPNVHRHPKFRNAGGYSENVDRIATATVYLPTHFGVSASYAHELAAALVRLV